MCIFVSVYMYTRANSDHVFIIYIEIPSDYMKVLSIAAAIGERTW